MTTAHVEVVAPFAMVPEALIYSPLSSGAVRVYAALARHGSDPENCRPSHERIASLTGVSRDTVKRAVGELIDGGWIERVARYDGRRQTANGYRIFDRPQGGCTSALGEGGMDAPPPGAPVPHEREPLKESHRKETPLPPAAKSTKTARKSPAARVASPPGFDEFWTIYPRKEGKLAARKAYTKALDKVTPAVLAAGAQRYRDAPSRASRPIRYTAHPATWLNAERWDDEPETTGPILTPEPKGWGVLHEMHQELRDERDRDPRHPGRPDGGVPELRAVEAHSRVVGARPALGAGR